jgi:Bacterial Ig-like domain (group 3)
VVTNSGTSSLSGTYSGDSNYSGSASAAVAGPVIAKANTTTSVSATPNPSVVGQAVTVSVVVNPVFSGTPSGTVGVSDGAGASCSITLISGKGSCPLTPTSAGSRNITATYGGDANFNGSSAAAPQVISKASTVIIVGSSPNPSVVGQPVAVSVSLSATFALLPTGTVSVSDQSGASCLIALVAGAGQCALSPTKAGSDIITASYAGDGNFNSASGASSQQVAKGNTTTTVTSAPNPATLNQPITVSFTVAANSPAVGSPTGTVTVTDTTGASCSGTLTSGKGSCSLTPKAVGSDTVTATYAGDTNFNTSAGTLSQALVLYKFNGFFTPLGPAGTYSGAFNFGKVVPVKWQLTDNNGNIISSLSSLTRMTAYFNEPAPASGTCPISTIGSAIVLYLPTSGAAGNSTFRFSSNQFVFNWDTSSADPYGRGCFTLAVQLNDGSVPKVTSILLQ